MDVAPGTIAPAALAAAARARVTLVLGASDAGKTTLVTRLAGALATPGAPVAVVDGDLGQSEIGPPTTVGLGRVAMPLPRLAAAELIALQFVGVTSPVKALRDTPRATAALVARARAQGYARILVDTSGMIAADLGRALKRMKIDLTDADVVLALQRADECEHILRAYEGRERPVIVRLPVTGVGRRSPERRRLHREQALAAYFARAMQVTVARDVLGGVSPVADVSDTLVGIRDASGETVGIGRVAGVTDAGVVIDTPVRAARIASLTLGREKYRPA